MNYIPKYSTEHCESSTVGEEEGILRSSAVGEEEGGILRRRKAGQRRIK